jgi:hypothetical protein
MRFLENRCVSISHCFVGKKGTIVLEGVDTSLMAKVTPAKLNHSVFNSGLLATLIGTLGRVLADFFITMGALLDVFVLIDFVSAIYFPLLVRAYFPVLCCCFFPLISRATIVYPFHTRTYIHTHTHTGAGHWSLLSCSQVFSSFFGHINRLTATESLLFGLYGQER